MIVTKKFAFSHILKKAIEEASLSTHQHHVGAVIFKGKRIISSAHNEVRSNNIPNKFRNYLESLHAEAKAIMNARKDLSGYSILVIRVNKKGKLLNAKPCEFCHGFIEFVNIKKIYYSNEDGEIELLKI